MTVAELIAQLQEDAEPNYTVDARVDDCPRCGQRGDDFPIDGVSVISSPGYGGWITLHLEATGGSRP